MLPCVEAALAQLWRVDNRADLFILAESRIRVIGILSAPRIGTPRRP